MLQRKCHNLNFTIYSMTVSKSASRAAAMAAGTALVKAMFITMAMALTTTMVMSAEIALMTTMDGRIAATSVVMAAKGQIVQIDLNSL